MSLLYRKTDIKQKNDIKASEHRLISRHNFRYLVHLLSLVNVKLDFFCMSFVELRGSEASKNYKTKIIAYSRILNP